MSTGDGRDGTIRSRVAKGRLSGKLAGMSLPRQILTIAFWPFLEQVLSFLNSSTSLFLSTHMNTASSVTAQIAAGMGAIGHVLFLGFVMQGAVGMGATAIVSRMTGARRFDEANHGVCQAAALGLMVGILSFAVMFLSTELLVTKVFQLTPDAQEFARRYMNIASFSAIFSGIVFAVNAALRGSGDTRLPFTMMLVADGLNIVVSVLLVYVLGMSIEGLAIGTVSGFAMAAAILVWTLRRRHRAVSAVAEGRSLDELAASRGPDFAPQLYLDRRDLLPDWGMIRRIIAIGLPQAIEVFGIWLIHLYCLAVISELGDDVLAAHTIAVRIESLSFLPGFAIGMASSAIVGLYLGANSPRMAYNTIRHCVLYSVCFMGGMGLLFFIFPAFFVSFFAGNAESLLAVGVPVVRVFLLCEPFFAASIVMKMSLRGAGDTRRVMWVSYGVMGFFRVVLLSAWHHFFPDTLNLTGIWILFSIDQMVQAWCFYLFIRDKKWIRRRV